MSLKSFEIMEGGSIAKQTRFSKLLDLKFGEIDSFFSDPGLLWSKAEKEQQVQFTDFGGLDGSYLEVVSPPFQSFHEDTTKLASFQFEKSGLVEPEKGILKSPFSSLGIVNNPTRRCTRVAGKKVNVPTHGRECSKVSDPKLSTNAIIRLAGEKFIQSCSGRIDDLSQLSNLFACSFMGLCDEESRDVELVQDLLACAEKVDQQQLDSAKKLISQFAKLSYREGNPVQRLVYYCADALCEKITQEMKGENKRNGSGKKQITDLQEALMTANPTIIAFHEMVPFSQVCQFTSVQTIIENVRNARKVHIIDFEIRNGMQWTVLMEALAARCEVSLQHLKITTVGTKSKSIIEETGERLKNFARSMNLPFSFNIVMVANMSDLNTYLFEWDDEEEVAVYLPFLLSTLIAQPDQLDCLIKLIKSINPCITAMSEVEANHSSPAFVNRFIEALFYYSSFFDCVSVCMADDEPCRKIQEARFGLVIKNIVAAEGAERIFRHISIDVWRMYFARFGLVETELSSASQYQAEVLIKKFEYGSCCTLDVDKKRLIIGWKGGPIFSVSAWKFLADI